MLDGLSCSTLFQVTTDWRLGTGTGCTDKHTGTSAAAPLAAGMVALMLEARLVCAVGTPLCEGSYVNMARY